MKLTPLDIRKQEFKKVVRGFDVDEVETFLDMVSEQFENLLREKRQLNEEVVKLQTQLRDYQQVESALKETLMNAQQNISESRETSKKEAEIIVREAELKAEEIIDGTKSKLLEMRNELLLLKAQKDSFVKRLKHLLQSQVELVEVLSSDDLTPGVKSKADSDSGEEEDAKSPGIPEPRIVGLTEEKEGAHSSEGTENPSTERREGQGAQSLKREGESKLSDEFII